MASLLSYALTNLSDVKESLGIASSDTTKDNLITRKINQATRQIEKYCQRRFASTTYTNEEYNATQIDELVLKNYPIITFTTLDVRNTGLNEDSWETITTDLYFVDTNSGVIYSDFRFNGRWKRFRATYTAGYATIPEDLAEACVSLACYYVNNADASDVGVYQRREGQRALVYQRNSTQVFNFLAICQQLGIDETLNQYAANPITPDR